MPSFVDEFMKSMGPEVIKGLSSNLGLDQKVTKQIIPQLIPLVLGGLKRQMDTHGGAPRVDHILNKYGSANVLSNLAGLFAKKASEPQADPRLGGLLGESGVQAASMLANKFKIDPSTIMRLIPMLAPVILGMLSQKRDQGGLGSMGIASLLDQDGDGSILDDVAGFLMKSPGGGSGLLGGVLGGLLGKKR